MKLREQYKINKDSKVGVDCVCPSRISPANARWQTKQAEFREENYNPHDYEHPFSSEALGQWE